MNRKEFAALAMALRTYYPRENLLPNDEALELWAEALQDVDATAAGLALKIWVKKNKWAPTIAELIEASNYAPYEAHIEQKRIERLTAAEDRTRIELQTERKIPEAVQNMLSSLQEMLKKEDARK